MKQIRLRSPILQTVADHYHTRLKHVILVLVLVFSGLTGLGIITISPAWPATATAFVTIFILPGFLLSGLIFRKKEFSWAERLPVTFVLAVGILSLPAVLLLLWHGNLAVLAWLATAINLGLGGLYIWVDGSKRAEPSAVAGSRGAASQSAEPLNLILLGAGLLAAAGVIYLFWTTAGTWSFGDNWGYLRYIRAYLDRPLAATVSTLVSDENVSNSFSPQALFNGWWVLQALMYRTAGFEPVDLYSFYFPPLLLILSLLAFYGLAHELFQNRNAALLALLVQVLYCLSSIGSHDWIGRGFFDRIIEDKFLIWLIILPVTQLLTLKYLKTGYKSYLLPLALGGVALALTHPMGLVQGGLSLGAFVFLYLLLSPQRSKIIKQAAIFSPLLLLLLIPLLQRQMLAGGNLAFGYAGGSEIQFILSRTRLWVLSAVDNSYMAHPQLIAHPLTVLAILLSPLLIRYLRQSIAAQFLFSNMAVTLLLLYNPLTAPLLGRLITPWMLWRVSWLLPVSLTVGFFLHKIVRWLQQALVKNAFLARRTVLPNIIPLLIVVMMALPLQGYIEDSLAALRQRRYNTMTEPERSLLLNLHEYIAPHSVILAEPAINTYIPAFVSSARVLTFRFNGLPSAREELERFYQTRLINMATFELLARRDVKYIIIERSHSLAFQFDVLPALFSRRYQNARYALYEVTSNLKSNHVVAGNTDYLQGEWKQAMVNYKDALALNPNDTLAHFGLGQVYQSQGRPAAAEAAYVQAIAIRPDNLMARLALAGLYANQGKTAEAIEQYRAAIKQRPDYPASYEALGNLYLRQDRENEARQQYQQAIAFPPGTGDYHLALGDLYRAKGLWAAAMAEYQAVITLDSLKKPVTGKPFGLIDSRNTIDNFRLERLLSAYLALGSIYQAQNRPDKALTAYQQAIALVPNNQEVYTRLGNIYLVEGDSEKTIVLYQDAARRNFNSAWPHVALGRIYLQRSNRE